MRVDVLTAVNMSMMVFRVVAPFEFVSRYHRFGGTTCFHLED
jgi:hypothetical protein